MSLINLENDLHAIADKVVDLGDTPGMSRNTQADIFRAVLALRDAAEAVGWDIMRADNEENAPSLELGQGYQIVGSTGSVSELEGA